MDRLESTEEKLQVRERSSSRDHKVRRFRSFWSWGAAAAAVGGWGRAAAGVRSCCRTRPCWLGRGARKCVAVGWGRGRCRRRRWSWWWAAGREGRSSCGGGAPPRLAWPRRRPVVKKMGIGEETRPASRWELSAPFLLRSDPFFCSLVPPLLFFLHKNILAVFCSSPCSPSVYFQQILVQPWCRILVPLHTNPANMTARLWGTSSNEYSFFIVNSMA